MDVLLMIAGGLLIGMLVMTHKQRSHDAMDQRLFDREFKGITENYYV